MKAIIVAFVLVALFACQQTEAKDCPLVCTMQYDPVCGSDGKTYGNACMLRGASCRSDTKIELVHKGHC